jgi:hypothetical protein
MTIKCLANQQAIGYHGVFKYSHHNYDHIMIPYGFYDINIAIIIKYIYQSLVFSHHFLTIDTEQTR